MKTICFIGYTTNAYVAYDCFFSQGQIVSAYCAISEEEKNPFGLRYLGNNCFYGTHDAIQAYDYCVTLENNNTRREVMERLIMDLGEPVLALHKTAVLSRTIQCGVGVIIGPRAIVNAFASIETGAIVGTGSIIETHCVIGKYTTLATGAIVGNNVVIGENTYIGAGSTLAPGIKIGNNVTVRAGSVVLHDIVDSSNV